MESEHDPPPTEHPRRAINFIKFLRRTGREILQPNVPDILYDHEIADMLFNRWLHPTYNHRLVRQIIIDTTEPQTAKSAKNRLRKTSSDLLARVEIPDPLTYPIIDDLMLYANGLEHGSQEQDAVIRLIKLQTSISQRYGSHTETNVLVLIDKIDRNLTPKN